jgi:hypothetical protein
MSPFSFGRVSVAVLALVAVMVGSIPLAESEDKTVKPYTITNARDMRFCEILIAKEGGIEVYNTTGVSDCPPQLWNALDLEKIQKELGASKVEKNGPKFWMMDPQTLSFGEKASFGGIEARWAARLDPCLACEGREGVSTVQSIHPEENSEHGVLQG